MNPTTCQPKKMSHEIRFTLSKQNYPLLYYKGHTYVKKRSSNGNTRVLWYCTRYKHTNSSMLTCPSRVAIFNERGKQVVDTEYDFSEIHDHEPPEMFGVKIFETFEEAQKEQAELSKKAQFARQTSSEIRYSPMGAFKVMEDRRGRPMLLHNGYHMVPHSMPRSDHLTGQNARAWKCVIEGCPYYCLTSFNNASINAGTEQHNHRSEVQLIPSGNEAGPSSGFVPKKVKVVLDHENTVYTDLQKRMIAGIIDELKAEDADPNFRKPKSSNFCLDDYVCKSVVINDTEFIMEN